MKNKKGMLVKAIRFDREHVDPISFQTSIEAFFFKICYENQRITTVEEIDFATYQALPKSSYSLYKLTNRSNSHNRKFFEHLKSMARQANPP